MIYIRNIYRAVERSKTVMVFWLFMRTTRLHWMAFLWFCISSLTYLAYVDSIYEKGLGMFEYEPNVVAEMGKRSDSSPVY